MLLMALVMMEVTTQATDYAHLARTVVIVVTDTQRSATTTASMQVMVYVMMEELGLKALLVLTDPTAVTAAGVSPINLCLAPATSP